MLKMKLMSLLKNPAIRISLITLTVILVIVNIISWPISKAEAPISVYFRAASMGVSAGTKDIEMPEVGPGQSDQATKAAKYDNVFCIDEGTHLNYAEYTKEIDLYNSSESSKYFKNYNSVLWIVDNMYISTASNGDESLEYLCSLLTSPEVEKNVSSYGTITSDQIKSLNKIVGNGKDISGNAINRNLLEVIEQLVIWNYTDNKDNTDASKYDKLVNGGLSGSNITNADQNACKYVYYALKYLANKNASYTSNGTTSNVVSLDASKAKIDPQNKQVGPYYLKANGVILNVDSNILSKISGSVENSDGSVRAINSDRIKINSDGGFYIDTASIDNPTKSTLEIKGIYSGSKTTAQVIINDKNQNLLNIKKTISTKDLNDSKELSYSGKYTVKLVKTEADGNTAIKDNPAVFTILGAVDKKGEKTDKNGVLTVIEGKEIKSETSTDTYTIVEDTAPEGYEKYNGTLTLNVKFKLNGSNFELDKDNTKLTGNGTNGTAKISFTDDSTIQIYVPNTPITETPKFDLSLRKFISKVDNKEPSVSREPVIDEESKEILDATTTAAYHHTKTSLEVKVGSQIEYTIRVYNEGEVDGYAKEITDYLPEGLKFVKIADESAKEYKLINKSEDTDKASVVDGEVILQYTGNSVIKADSIGRILKGEKENVYQEVKVICEVEEGAEGYLTNRAEITNYGYDDNGVWKEAKSIGNVDIDSAQNTISNSLGLETWYENAKTYTYTDSKANSKEITDYYPGVQDDDDFETVEVKTITGSYDIIIKKVDSSNKSQGLEGAYFSIGGDSSAKVGPTGKDGTVTVLKNQTITSDSDKKSITIKETTAPEEYDGYDEEIKLEIVTKLDDGKYILDTEKTTLTTGENDKVSLDINNETSVITITIANDKKDFDLSLRKFITKLNDKDITNRVPKVDVSKLKEGTVTTAEYEHTKDPVDVCEGNIVTYTLRVYNEGGVSGYATKVMDDVPDGLEFLPNDTINKQYNWIMYAESDEATTDSITYNKKIYVPTTDASKADLIVTDYLKDKLIKAFDPYTMDTLDYQDIKVAFKVVEPSTSDRIIINYAQITENKDSKGNTVTDRDSVPNEWNEGEDDQDIEKIKLQYFDLSLRKWVTQAIITENGQTQVIETGHKAEDNPEEIVKVDLKKSKLSQVTVKFRYSIRVTNEGDIAGYAKEVSDYIPSGLKFVANDNPDWKESDGKVVTTALADTLLQPGESAEVSILLTWINSESNMGVMTNTAEISEDYNEFGVPDRDSTPNNKVPGEDDIDDAPVMLTVKTGSAIILYVTLAFGVLGIIGLGLFGIKKYIK